MLNAKDTVKIVENTKRSGVFKTNFESLKCGQTLSREFDISSRDNYVIYLIHF